MRATRENGFRPDIQGMRAIAVALVVLNHAGVPGVRGGYVGVDVFFVISGFPDHRPTDPRSRAHWRGVDPSVLHAPRPPDSARGDARLGLDRHRRLRAHELRAGEGHADASVWTAFFAANFHFAHLATNYFDRAQPAVAVPALLVPRGGGAVLSGLAGAARGNPARRTAAAPLTDDGSRLVAAGITIASLAWSIHDTTADPYGAYFSPFVRGWELGLGALLASRPPASYHGSLALSAPPRGGSVAV